MLLKKIIKKRTQVLKFITLNLIIFIFALACNKDIDDSLRKQQENIQISEIVSWYSWFEKTFPNPPKLKLELAEKCFFNNQFYIRIPVINSTGNVYFAKNKYLEVVFIRELSTKNNITGEVLNLEFEIIDLNKFTYSFLSFRNKPTTGMRKMSFTIKESINESMPTSQLDNSWFNQLLFCLSHYIISVPAKDESGEWNNCWILGGENAGSLNQNSTYSEIEANDNGNINWPAFLAGVIFPISGPDPIPTTGGSNWSLLTPPSSSTLGRYYFDSTSNYSKVLNQLEDDPFSEQNLTLFANSLGRYWEAEEYDNIPFPIYDILSDGPRDSQGYRKNGIIYNYSDGSIQNYTNDVGGKKAIFTHKSTGVQIILPGVTITDFGVLNAAGVTTANGGIHLSLNNNGIADIEHEYGHYLQALELGKFNYYLQIVPASLKSATINPIGHRFFWTEVDANRKAVSFFGSSSAIALSTYFPK